MVRGLQSAEPAELPGALDWWIGSILEAPRVVPLALLYSWPVCGQWYRRRHQLGVGHEGYSSGNGLLAATVLGKNAGDAASAELIGTRYASRTLVFNYAQTPVIAKSRWLNERLRRVRLP